MPNESACCEALSTRPLFTETTCGSASGAAAVSEPGRSSGCLIRIDYVAASGCARGSPAGTARARRTSREHLPRTGDGGRVRLHLHSSRWCVIVEQPPGCDRSSGRRSGGLRHTERERARKLRGRSFMREGRPLCLSHHAAPQSFVSIGDIRFQRPVCAQSRGPVRAGGRRISHPRRLEAARASGAIGCTGIPDRRSGGRGRA